MIRLDENNLELVSGGDYRFVQISDGRIVCVACYYPKGSFFSVKYLVPNRLVDELFRQSVDLSYYDNLTEKDCEENYGVNKLVLHKIIEAFNA